MKVARRTPGPASANLQWRKPREVRTGRASDAMGISSLAVRCRGALIASLGSGRRGGELGWPIAIGRIGVARRRLTDKAVVQGGATASKAVADREPAQQKFSSGMSPRIQSDHDVSTLIAAGDAAGR
jgi:hypothetical protein